MRETAKHSNSDRRWVWRYLGLTAAGWTVAMACIAFWYVSRQPANRERLARTYARAAHQRDVLYRRWVAMLGGVYAPTGEQLQPNPYLKVAERDIITPSGRKLTLVNPAYMTRLVHELARTEDDIEADITSLNPINPKNQADAWEREALKAFEEGRLEVSEVVEVDGQPHLRLMRPLFVEKPCLACHAQQGYHIGDIRGGISVSLPVTEFWQDTAREARNVLIGYAIVLVCGLAVILGGGWILVRRMTQRDRLLRSLHESEQRYRRLYEESNDAVFIVDAEGRIIDVNERAIEMLGYTPDELISRRVTELHSDETAAVAQTVLSRIAQEDCARVESVLQRKNGSCLDVEISARVIDRQRGEVQGIVRDVTARNQAVRALEASQRELSFRNRLADIFLTQPDEQVYVAALKVIRERFRSRFGYFGYISQNGDLVCPSMTRDVWEACQIPDKDIVFPAEQWSGLWGQSLREKRAILQNDSLKVPEGHIPIRNVLLAPIVNQGRLVGQICVANAETDYTPEDLALLQRVADYIGPLLEARLEREIHAEHRRRSEAALRDQLELLETLLNTIPSAIFYKDRQGRYLGCNETCARWMGVSREDLIGKSVHELFPPRLADKYAEADAQLFREGGRQTYEFAMQAGEEGPSRDVLFHKAVYRDANGKIAGLVGIATDITQRKETEAALAAAKQQAEAANRAKSDFLANMSHEIRTPMTAILGFTEMLLHGNLDKDLQQEHLETIHRNGAVLLELINDILDLSKIEVGRMELEFEKTSPFEMVESVCSLMEVRASGKGLSLETKYEFPLPAEIRTDPVRLRQILVNLIGNAVKFTADGFVRITVGCDCPQGGTPEMRFRVEDSGIGLSQKEIGRLFQPFTQADTSTTRRYGGTGLGLAISQRLAEMLGGRIDVESQPGVGSTFTLRLDPGRLDELELVHHRPTTESQPAPGALTKQPARANKVDSNQDHLVGKVLLAEDGPDNQRLIGLLLSKAGLDVDLAENGEVACRLAIESRESGAPYDLILMDMQMPKVDGYEATGQLREKGWGGPIIALTAHAMTGDRQRCIDVGCTDYLSKPIQREAFLATLRRYLSVASSAGYESPGR